MHGLFLNNFNLKTTQFERYDYSDFSTSFKLSAHGNKLTFYFYMDLNQLKYLTSVCKKM